MIAAEELGDLPRICSALVIFLHERSEESSLGRSTDFVRLGIMGGVSTGTRIDISLSSCLARVRDFSTRVMNDSFNEEFIDSDKSSRPKTMWSRLMSGGTRAMLRWVGLRALGGWRHVGKEGG
mmetsp:Transcript_29489/g.71673  ORF Transcript_29489/g.71673 Transcript_29489/m.71673 type:complete len:123 (+) Transcript_29489:734-1102(+)